MVGATEVVVDVVLGGSGVSGSLVGNEVDVVVVAVGAAVAAVVVVDAVLVVVVDGVAVTAGSDVSSACVAGGSLCACAAGSVVSAVVVTVSGCGAVAVTAADVAAGLLVLLSVEQAASRAADTAIDDRKIFALICLDGKPATQQY